jgi:Flp pilus assembly protein TadD
VAVAEDVLRVEPRAVTAHSFLGLARLGLADRAEAGGRKEEADRLVTAAAAALREAVRVKPDFAPGHIYLARALVRLGQFGDAERAARDAIRSRPEEWETHLVLGEVLAAAGRKPEAAAAFEQSAKLAHPDEPRPKRALAELNRK